MISRLSNILLPHKLIEIIFRRFFPAKQPEVTEKDNLIEVMAQYFLLVNEIPYDNFSIQFYEDKWVHIKITYDSAEDAYEHIDALKEYQLEKDMSDMFPYMFVVESCVS